MSGRILAIILVAFGLVAGAAMYYLQIYAYYDRVALAAEGGDVTLRITTVDGTVEDLPATGFEGIDSFSSPIRFRGCFRTEADPVGFAPYPDATPLIAPGWFDCFDAEDIGTALESGVAAAYLGEANVSYGIDRIIAIFPDGRAYAWHQINSCGEVVFDGDPPPPGCPPVPERLN